MPDLTTLLLGIISATILVCWVGLALLITTGVVLRSEPDSVVDGVDAALEALPIAMALAPITMLEFVSGQQFLSSDFAER